MFQFFASNHFQPIKKPKSFCWLILLMSTVHVCVCGCVSMSPKPFLFVFIIQPKNSSTSEKAKALMESQTITTLDKEILLRLHESGNPTISSGWNGLYEPKLKKKINSLDSFRRLPCFSSVLIDMCRKDSYIWQLCGFVIFWLLSSLFWKRLFGNFTHHNTKGLVMYYLSTEYL